MKREGESFPLPQTHRPPERLAATESLMKLLLKKSESREIADLLRPRLEGGVEAPEATLRIVEHFHATHRDPWTRRDLDSVLLLLGHPKSTDDDLWPIIDGKLDQHPLFAEKLPRRGAGRYGFHDTPAETPEEATAPAETPAPVTPAPAVTGASWLPAEAPVKTSGGWYDSDVGLRRMAVDQTSCYGHFSTRAPTCSSCPLAAYCAPASQAAMADIAAELDKLTEKALADAARPTPKPTPEAPTPEPAEPEGDLPPGAHSLEIPFEGYCTKCGETMAEGSIGVHVPGKGMLHPACARS